MKVGFFDNDGTISRNQQIVNFVELLFERGIYPLELKSNIDKTYSNWQNRTGTFSEFIHAVVDVFYQNIQGKNYDKFCEIAEENAELHWQQTYSFSLDLIGKLRDKGYFLVLISHAPKLIVRPFAKRYGFNKVYGRFLEIDNNRNFTGNLINEEAISDKAKIVRHVMQKYNLEFEGSIAVGDSHGDISMLQEVQRPLCINPNDLLLAQAKEKNWSVVVERKNVFFVVNPDQDNLRQKLFQTFLD